MVAVDLALTRSVELLEFPLNIVDTLALVLLPCNSRLLAIRTRNTRDTDTIRDFLTESGYPNVGCERYTTSSQLVRSYVRACVRTNERTNVIMARYMLCIALAVLCSIARLHYVYTRAKLTEEAEVVSK